MDSIDESILTSNDVYLNEKGKLYALLCCVKFNPVNDEIPKYLQRKGYDYIARERKCELNFEITNISSRTFPGRDNPIVFINSSDNKTVFQHVSSQGIPELESGQTCSIKVPVNRRNLNGDIEVNFYFLSKDILFDALPLEIKQQIELNSQGTSIPKTFPLANIPESFHASIILQNELLDPQAIIFSRSPNLEIGVIARPNVWFDSFYVLSLEKEIEQEDSHSSMMLSRRSFWVSMIALAVSFIQAFLPLGEKFSKRHKTSYEVSIRDLDN